MTTIEELHEAFCKASDRPEPLRFARGLWTELLATEEYKGDLQLLRRDVGFVVWYLRDAIKREQRRPGSLKLRNLLKPEQFAADLAEAIGFAPRKYKAHCFKHAAGEVSQPAVSQASSLQGADTETIAKQGAASLRAWRESQLGK